MNLKPAILIHLKKNSQRVKGKNSKKIRIGNYENLVIESQKKTKKFESDLKYCSYF